MQIFLLSSYLQAYHWVAQCFATRCVCHLITCQPAFTACLIDCCHFHKDGRIRNFYILHATITSTIGKLLFLSRRNNAELSGRRCLFDCSLTLKKREWYILPPTVHGKCSYSTFAYLCIVLHFWEVSRHSIFESFTGNCITFVLTQLGYMWPKYTHVHLKCNLKSISWKQSHFQLNPKEAE